MCWFFGRLSGLIILWLGNYHVGNIILYFDGSQYLSFYHHWKFGIATRKTGSTICVLLEHKSQLIGNLQPYGEEPFVASLETSTFGSPGGGKESMCRLYLVTTVYYFATI